MSNVYSRATWLRRCAPVVLALACIVAATPAFADPLYEAYCIRDKVTETRSLCFEEAAALADRQAKPTLSANLTRSSKRGSETRAKSADGGS